MAIAGCGVNLLCVAVGAPFGNLSPWSCAAQRAFLKLWKIFELKKRVCWDRFNSPPDVLCPKGLCWLSLLTAKPRGGTRPGTFFSKLWKMPAKGAKLTKCSLSSKFLTVNFNNSCVCGSKVSKNLEMKDVSKFTIWSDSKMSRLFPKLSMGSKKSTKRVKGIHKVLETISRNWDRFSVGWPWVHTAARFSTCFLVTIAGECLSNKRTQVLKQHETHHKIITWYCFEFWKQTWYTGIPQKFNIGSM